jgi:hypothetical protein
MLKRQTWRLIHVHRGTARQRCRRRTTAATYPIALAVGPTRMWSCQARGRTTARFQLVRLGRDILLAPQHTTSTGLSTMDIRKALILGIVPDQSPTIWRAAKDSNSEPADQESDVEGASSSTSEQRIRQAQFDGIPSGSMAQTHAVQSPFVVRFARDGLWPFLQADVPRSASVADRMLPRAPCGRRRAGARRVPRPPLPGPPVKPKPHAPRGVRCHGRFALLPQRKRPAFQVAEPTCFPQGSRAKGPTCRR